MADHNPYAAPGDPSGVPHEVWAVGYPRRRMRFWRIEQLKAEMIAQPLSEREVLPYLLLYVGFFTFATGLPNQTFNTLDGIETLLSVLIAIVGTVVAYFKNGGINGQFFLQRYFAVGFIVAVRCTAVFLVIIIAMIVVLDTLGILSDETTWYELVVTVGFQVLLYWRIARHVADIRESVPESTSTIEPVTDPESR